MKYIQRISTGPIQSPNIDLIYGGPGIGKTSWAAGAKDHFFLDIEGGTKKLKITRMDPAPKNFMEVLAAIDELYRETHTYKVLVIDSLDHLEMMVWDQTMASNNIKSRADFNAYSRGPDLALEHWARLITALKLLKEKMGIILICHSSVRQVNDPFRSSVYDRHDLKIHKKAAALVVESCDSVLFAHKEPRKAIDGNIVQGNELRKLYTSSTIAHEGKNRDSLPYSLPLDYEEFVKAKSVHAPEAIESILSKIQTRLEMIKDQETKTKVKDAVERDKEDASKLALILNRLEVLTSK